MPSSIDAITDASNAAANAAATAAGLAPEARKNDDLDKDAFLKLMVAQLRYQDPLNPADSQAFMAQTAQFTQVERLSELVEQGANTLAATGISTAASLLGRNIEYLDLDGKQQVGKVTAATPTVDGVLLHVGDKNISLDRLVKLQS